MDENRKIRSEMFRLAIRRYLDIWREEGPGQTLNRALSFMSAYTDMSSDELNRLDNEISELMALGHQERDAR